MFTFTRSGVVRGMWLTLPMCPSVLLFSLALGSLAAQKGLSLAEFTALNSLVYAGMSQMVALGIWQDPWTWTGLFAVVISTIVINSRILLMSAALRPLLGALPPRLNYAQLALLTDANYLVYIRHTDRGGRDAGVLVGSGLMMWFVWVLGGIPGYLLGALIADPKRFGLDAFVPIYFLALAVPLWRGRRSLWPWSAAAATALLVHTVLGGHWHVLAAVVVGMCVGAAVRDA
jgi:predicted branched-subunit amino acid permease